MFSFSLLVILLCNVTCSALSGSFDGDSLEGEILFFGLGMLVILFASAAGWRAAYLTRVAWKPFFFGFGLLVILFAMSAAVRSVGGLTGVACSLDGQYVF